MKMKKGFRKPNKPKYKCPVCKIKFRLKQSYNDHMITHKDWEIENA